MNGIRIVKEWERKYRCMQRYFIYFCYDGTAYHGWQIQPNGMSVQETLQNALSTILRQCVEIVGAGRTDTGVHARMMVAHLDLAEEMECEQLTYKLNRLLPRDISVFNIQPVDSNMHARFSAKWRTYRYFIHTRKDPFLRNYSYESPYPLDFELMEQGAELLKQHQDFAAFCKSGADNTTTLCTIKESKWVKTSPYSWYFEITANRFLRNMVRATVGTLILLGRHRITIKDLERILEEGNRSQAGESMPGHALFLENIEY